MQYNNYLTAIYITLATIQLIFDKKLGKAKPWFHEHNHIVRFMIYV